MKESSNIPIVKLQKGFTLLEAIVVISVIVLLAAMVFPFARPILNSHKTAKARKEMFAIRIALEEYYRKNADFPSTLRDNEFFGQFLGGGKRSNDIVYDEFGRNQYYNYARTTDSYPNSVTITSRGKDGSLSTDDDLTLTFTSERVGREVTRERLQVISKAAYYWILARRDFSTINETTYYPAHWFGLTGEYFYDGWGENWIVHNTKLRIYSKGPDNVDDTGGETDTSDLADDDIGW